MRLVVLLVFGVGCLVAAAKFMRKEDPCPYEEEED